jgi:hypothetical protein
VTLAVEIDPSLPTIETLRAAAEVTFVDEAPGFQASVMVAPGCTPVARIAHALIGHQSEGRVLREVMLATTGLWGFHLFLWVNDALLCLTP